MTATRGAAETAGQFTREQNVAELGQTVGAEWTVAFRLQIFEAESRFPVRFRCRVDDPCIRRQDPAQPFRQTEVRHVVEGKGLLQSFGGDAAMTEERSGVVDENIDSGLDGSDLPSGTARFGHQRKIGVMNAMFCFRRDAGEASERGLASFRAASHQNQSRSHGSESLGRLFSDAGRCPRNDHDLPFHRSGSAHRISMKFIAFPRKFIAFPQKNNAIEDAAVRTMTSSSKRA